MRSVLRAFVMTASFASLAECGRPAFAGAAPPVDEKQIRLWSGWWMNETGQQAVPIPQLLYVRGQHSKTDVRSLEQMDGRLNVTCSVTDLHPSSFGGRHEWWRAKAGRLSTEGLELPSAVWSIADEEYGAFMVLRVFEGDLPALCSRPPQEYGRTFFWLKNMRAPITIRSSIFSGAQFEDDDHLSLNIQKWPFDYAEDLRPFLYVRNLMLKCPFFNLDHYCY